MTLSCGRHPGWPRSSFCWSGPARVPGEGHSRECWAVGAAARALQGEGALQGPVTVLPGAGAAAVGAGDAAARVAAVALALSPGDACAPPDSSSGQAVEEEWVSRGWPQQAGNGASNFVNQYMTNTSTCSAGRSYNKVWDQQAGCKSKFTLKYYLNVWASHPPHSPTFVLTSSPHPSPAFG